MTKRRSIFACLLFALLFSNAIIFPTTAFSALTQDPSLHWRTLYTDHFEIHFHTGENDLAHEVAEISERVHNKLSKTFNWAPESRTQIVVTDRFDFSNGLAYPIPRNWMLLIINAPDSFSSLGDYDNWLELLIIHEYTHVLHFDKVSGVPKALRNVFGRFLFLFPNIIQPPWMIEGLATYEETDSEHGIGRGQNSYYRMLMRLEVENGIKPLNQVNQPLVSWPMNTSRYLYGVYFYQFIRSRYGEEKIQQLIENYSDNIIPLAINSNSKETLGKTISELWEEFNDYLKKEFLPEIQNIRKAGITDSKKLTHSGYFNSSPKTTPNGDVYFIQRDMQSEPRLMVIRKNGSKPHVVAESRGRYFDIHPQAGIVVAELDSYNNTNIFSDLNHINPRTGKKTKITHGGRYLYASWSPDGKKIIAVHSELGEHALHLLDSQGKFLKKLWQGNNKIVLGPPDWSPRTNKLIFSVWRPETQWNLETFDINRSQWKQLTHSKNIETTPNFTTDGQKIIFSADYDGVFNLYRLNLTNGKIVKISNVVGGAFSPTPARGKTSQSNQGIYYTATGKNGFDLFYQEKLFDLATAKDYARNSPTNKNKIKTTKLSYPDNSIEDYNALSRIIPTGWYPHFLKTKYVNEIGFNTWGSDPIRRHSYTLMAAYDTDNKWYVGRLDYLYDRWDPTLKFSLSRRTITYLDNNDDIERYRNQDTFTTEAIWPILSYEQQWLLHVGLVHKTETDKDIRSSFGSLNATNDDLTGVALSYNSTQIYPISISPNNGRQVKIIAEDYDFFKSFHTGQAFTLDWREYFSLTGQHVVTARGVAAWGTDMPERFRLGGTQETSVSAQPVNAAYAATERIFGQRNYPLHGYPKGGSGLTGTHMLLAELEWLFPIARIERGLMAPPIGLHQVYGKLFYNWGETWNENFKIPSLRRGAGAELTMDAVLGYWLPLDISFGYAKGFDRGGEEQTYIEIRALF
jgi:hypothetical protein